MKILVFSDSHGDVSIMDKYIGIEKPDLLVHAGDYTVNRELISARFDYWVDGNNDFPHEKPSEDFQIGRFTFNLQHGHMLPLFSIKKIVKKMKSKGYDVLIHGHTHVPRNETIGKILIFNPGSCRYPRSDSGRTYGVININNDKIFAEIKKILD